MKMLEIILRKWFSFQTADRRLDKHFAKLLEKIQKDLSQQITSQAENQIVSTVVKVSCVQRQITLVKNVEEYIDILNSYVHKAVELNSQLVVFPEYNFFDLSGLLPGMKILNKYLKQVALKAAKKAEKSTAIVTPAGSEEKKLYNEIEVTAKEDGITVLLFKAISEPVSWVVESTFAFLAKTYGIYIYTGSYISNENGILYNTGSLYGPDGKLIGTQKKIHLTSLEAKMSLGCGNELKVYQLPIGNIAFPVCMDATYFETFYVARKLQADIVIIPIANPEEYNLWKALEGIWPRVQESYVYGLKAALNGWLIGMHYTGKAGIFSPLTLTSVGDGVIALAKSHEGDELVTAKIDISRLREARTKAEYHGDSNPAYERDFVEKTYTSKQRS